MGNKIRIEIISKNSYWHNAVFVEWEYQFPDRKIEQDGDKYYIIPENWREDLEKVAGACFSKVLLAPDDPGRRNLFRRLFARED